MKRQFLKKLATNFMHQGDLLDKLIALRMDLEKDVLDYSNDNQGLK